MTNTIRNLLISMVPGAGLEPARYFYRGILSPSFAKIQANNGVFTWIVGLLSPIQDTLGAQTRAQQLLQIRNIL